MHTLPVTPVPWRTCSTSMCTAVCSHARAVRTCRTALRMVACRLAGSRPVCIAAEDSQKILQQDSCRVLPMIMTRLPEPLLSLTDVTGGFSAVSTAVGPDGPRMSLARLGLRHLLAICNCRLICALPSVVIIHTDKLDFGDPSEALWTAFRLLLWKARARDRHSREGASC